MRRDNYARSMILQHNIGKQLAPNDDVNCITKNFLRKKSHEKQPKKYIYVIWLG